MLDSLRIFGKSHRPNKMRIFLRTAKFSHKILFDVFYDVSRYIKYSSTYHLLSQDNLKSRITARYHEIEKGLSLSEPRMRFGADKIDELIFLMREYIDQYGVDEFLSAPCGTLRAYEHFHINREVFDYPRKQKIQTLLSELDTLLKANVGGVALVSAQEIYDATKNVTSEFFFRRHSIRQFSPEPVRSEDIDAAIAIALKAPAVCNRQDGYVHVIEDKELIMHMTKMHGGAKGFSEQIEKLLVVTNKLTNFWGSAERNQCWIDGGLFAMSLILGLHAQNLGTCCLNWSKTAKDDRAMRELLSLPDSEVIIMLLAVGHIPDSLEVAYSARKSVSESRRYILKWNKSPSADSIS